MTRSFAKTTTIVFLSALFAFFLTRSAPASAADEGKCTLPTKGDTPTARACAKGGRAEAKKVMKEMVKNAKEKGVKFTCDSCHKDLDNYALTPNGEADYKKLEAASGIK
jgi:hypothetical protein